MQETIAKTFWIFELCLFLEKRIQEIDLPPYFVLLLKIVDSKKYNHKQSIAKINSNAE